MKHIILSLLVGISFLSATAQQDTILNKYTGKYKFPEGSPVTEITIAVDNGTLQASSAMGNTEFKKTDTPDVFVVVVYAGTATFKKNTDGKVTGVSIAAGGVNMEGVRVDAANTDSHDHFAKTNVQIQIFNNQRLR